MQKVLVNIATFGIIVVIGCLVLLITAAVLDRSVSIKGVDEHADAYFGTNAVVIPHSRTCTLLSCSDGNAFLVYVDGSEYLAVCNNPLHHPLTCDYTQLKDGQ